nr:hypothetical protein [Tanacetum cinerariifolium]
MILTNLQEVQNAVKEDHALNKKVLDTAEAYTKNSSNLIELLALVKDLDFSSKSTIESLHAAETLQSDMATLKTDTADTKATVTKIFYAFKGQAFFTPLETQPITKEGGSSQITPRVNKGKVMAIKDYSPPPKLVKVSREERVKPNGPVLIDLEIDGKIGQILNAQLQAYLDKKEQMKQAEKEAELSKPKIIKVAIGVFHEAKVQIQGGKDFIKHQDTEFKVLTRAHTKKLKQRAELRKKRYH